MLQIKHIAMLLRKKMNMYELCSKLKRIAMLTKSLKFVSNGIDINI